MRFLPLTRSLASNCADVSKRVYVFRLPELCFGPWKAAYAELTQMARSSRLPHIFRHIASLEYQENAPKTIWYLNQSNGLVATECP